MSGCISFAVAQIHTLYQGSIACASGADRFKVELQLEKCGLMPYFKDRIFSGHELPRRKTAPNLYLTTFAKPARATQYNAYTSISQSGSRRQI